jgi:capsular exopolysaccharide synthesis family protein
MAIAVAVGLALGVGLAFLIEYLDTSVKTISDLEHAFGVPVLAVIPRGAQSLIQLPSNVPIAEGYRIMRANIILRTEGLSKALTVVSGGQGEGKSTTINNLAYVFAKGGYKTLIIDADIRRPSQHEFFGIKKDFGLADYLLNGSPYNELIKDSGVTNLSILTSGICDLEDIDILDSPKIMELIRDSKSSYDIVFIDSPPILAIGDASVIANAVDMVIVVVQHCRFPKAMLERLKQRLNDMRANVIGCVLNNTDVRHDQSYAYYGGYYEYYGPQESKNTAIQASRKIDSSKMGKHGEY